uniref:Uncharacterized protein n=1 Tax=Oryza meridionalis TaxID=40149 RepID=A0A0E0E389_9ORYZ
MTAAPLDLSHRPREPTSTRHGGSKSSPLDRPLASTVLLGQRQRRPQRAARPPIWRRRSTACKQRESQRAFGSSPLRVLLVRIRTCKDVLLANDSGILPVRAFLPRSTYVSERVLPNECGMSPESLLLASSSVRSSARSPKAEVRSAIQGDMEPVIPSDERSRAVTRRGYCVLQVTPCQLQNSMDALLHEDKTSAELVSWDFKQRRACRSLSSDTWRMD